MSEREESYVRSVAAHQKIKEKEFWLNRLGGEIKKTSFPFDYKTTEKNKPHMETLDFTFQGEIFERLMGLSNNSDLRLFIILLTTLVMLLEKYTGSKDIIMGSPINKQEVQGELINTVLVLRNQFHGDMTVKELLLQASHINFEAAEHQNYPMETLLYQLNIPFEGDEFPLFDIIVILENIHDRNYIEHIQTNICIDFVRTGSEVQGAFEFNTRRYNRGSIQRIISHYTRLLERSLKDINLPIKDIELLSEAEKREILVDFNRSSTDFPGDKPLHELFRLQAEQTPGKTALSSGDSLQLTYGELNRISNGLAYRLKSKGVVPDTIVGIMVGRSLEMLVGILGILKAGGAYLPIDPKFPAARAAFMLEDCRSRLLLSGRKHIHRFEGGAFKQEIIDLGDNGRVKVGEPGSHPETVNTGADLAYVIFTSGSTGKSKGILTCHRNVVRVVKNTNYIDIREKDRLLQLSNYAFDGSVFDIFGALLNGAGLVSIKDEDLATANRLAHIIRKENITLFFLTTALFNLLTEIDIHCFMHVRKVLFGGEVVSVKHAEKALEYLGKNRMIHMYGPTETTVYTTYYSIPAIEANAGTIPIGKPISNTVVYILDEYLNPLPIGGIGEIFIGGEGAARGYLNNPELTDNKFLINSQIPMQPCIHAAMQYRSPPHYPITPLPHHPIYMTGDLGRWLPGGNIEFIGRKDFQVKIRGFRIELEEIEMQLLNHKEIKEARVLVWEKQETRDKYLVAYFVPGRNVGETGLKDYLKKSLPYYMIPQYFISLEKMPLTPNGKVDSRALPEPGAGSTAAFIAPRDSLERKLVEIWSRVLGVEKAKIGIDSDFFELDGHSLKVTVLISKIHKELDVKVELKEIFRTPTIRELSGYIKALKKDRYAAIAPAEKKVYYPPSPAQKRLYILQVFEQESAAYNIPQRIPLEGEPDRQRLEDIFRKLIKRHESLRTSFHLVADEPVQRIHDKVELEIEFYDVPGTDRSSFIEKPNHSFIRPFDLGHAPLLRAALVKDREEGHFLLLDMHHIITDGTSQGVLINDFKALGQGKYMTPLRLQYKDYSEWQNSREQKQLIRKQETFWINRFPDELPVLNLPTDFPRPLKQSFEGASVFFLLNKEETGSLKNLAKENDATLYMMFLAIFNILLFKLSGHEDIIVGTPVAARRHADLEHIVGMFVNTLPMRNSPTGPKTFTQFLDEVKQMTLTAYENQEYPFEELVDQISVPRDISRNPLFDVMFNWWDHSDYPGDISEITGEGQFKHKKGTAKFDLNLTAVDYGEWFYFNLEYCTRLFKPARIDKFIEYFKKILYSVLEDSNRELSAIKIFSDKETEEILKISRGEKKILTKNLTIPGLFEKKVKQVPDAAAVIFEDQILGYKELNRRANQLALFLKKKGVGPGAIVGLMVTRSLEMIIGLLAIMKAGGAYLPISPVYPGERKKYMMRDGQIRLLLTNCKSESVLEDIPGGIEILDIRHRELYGGDSGSPRHISKGTDPVYVIYTSGSTGKPKGVMLEHRNVVNLFIYDFEYTNIDCSKILQFHTIGFDASFHEIFCALLSGNRLYLIPEEMQTDIPRLFQLVEKHQVKTLFLPMSFLRVIFNDKENIKYIPGCVSHIQTAGEQVIVNEWFRRYLQENKVYLHNHYGPSETHVVTALTLNPTDDIPEFPPIGRPILNTDIYILSKDSQLLPVGVPGELCIGGLQVGKGYLGKEELTKKKFIENPFAKEEKLYKSGDLARWKPDGNIEFLGRIDHQVKIRGMRVEPGEIETVLLNHKEIREAVVLAREDKQGDKYLCTYIVSDRDIPGSELRAYLSGELPGYMIPSYFERIDKIPVSPNGKVDRRALPQPFIKTVKDIPASAAPGDELEAKLAEIWSGVLGIEKDIIDIHGNFFELGGHSLKATILTVKVHKALEVNLPLAEVFKTPTIRGLAGYIRKIAGNKYKYISISPVEKKEYYELSSAQKRLYIIQQMELSSTAYNIIEVVAREGDIDIGQLEAGFGKLIERHEAFRTSFKMINGSPRQVIHDAADLKIDYYEPGCRARREAGKAIEEHCASIIKKFIRSFDLSHAPLLRVGVIKIDEKDHVLMVDMHHIISDAVSRKILIRDFKKLYKGEELAAARLQYKDFSEWQNRLFQSEEIKKQEKYWLKVFSGKLPRLNMPRDYPGTTVKTVEGDLLNFQINSQLTQQLRRFANESKTTLFMVLLAAYNVLFSKYTGQEDSIVGTPTAGRRHTDLEKVVGMFANTLALRNYPRSSLTFGKFLENVKENALNAFENQDYPFEVLVEKLGLKREGAENPLFNIVFNFVSDDIGNETENQRAKTPLELSPASYIQTATFDFSLRGIERKDFIFVVLNYRTARFRKKTAERLSHHFINILKKVVKNPGVYLSDINMLDEQEKERVVVEFNRLNDEDNYEFE